MLNDPTALLFEHRACHGSRAEEHSTEVEVDHRLPIVGFHPHQQAVPRDAGVVHQHIQTAAALQHRLDQAIHLSLNRHVGLQGIGLAP